MDFRMKFAAMAKSTKISLMCPIVKKTKQETFNWLTIIVHIIR